MRHCKIPVEYKTGMSQSLAEKFLEASVLAVLPG